MQISKKTIFKNGKISAGNASISLILVLGSITISSFDMKNIPHSKFTAAIQHELQDSYNGWGEYVNRIYNFRLRMPAECTHIEESGPIDSEMIEIRREKGTLSYGQERQKLIVLFGDLWQSLFSITVYDNPDSLSLRDFALKIFKSRDIYSESEIELTFSQFKGFAAVMTSYENKVGGYTGTVTPVFIKRKDYILKFFLLTNFKVKGEMTAYPEIHNKILDSLDFT